MIWHTNTDSFDAARILDLMGAIPTFLSVADPRPAAEQFNERYAHGGGWRPFSGWMLDENNVLQYPGDPPYKPVAWAHLGNEQITIYQHAWVCIKQADGSYEVCRMD
jgi:hypothetical protein